MSCLYAMTSFSCANETENKLWVAKMSRKNWGNSQYFTTSPYRQAYAAVGCAKNGPPNKSDCIFGSLPQINCSSMLWVVAVNREKTQYFMNTQYHRISWAPLVGLYRLYTLFVTYIYNYLTTRGGYPLNRVGWVLSRDISQTSHTRSWLDITIAHSAVSINYMYTYSVISQTRADTIVVERCFRLISIIKRYRER